LNAQQLGIGRLGDASVGGWIRLAIFERLLQQAEAAARPAGRQGLSAAGLGPTRQTTWLLQTENLLLFSPSGVGKTHLAIAITMAMAAQDQACRFFPATTLVQLLQKALPRPQAERAGGTRRSTTYRRCSRSSIATPCW
jgi:hypothetical protein